MGAIDYIILAAIAVCVAAVLRSLCRRAKTGGCPGCGSRGGCSNCAADRSR